MKKIVLIVLLITNLAWSQDTASVQLITRSLPEKVMLRWAVDKPLEWKRANEYGFWVERATISRNGIAVVPIERQRLTLSPLKPRPLEEWADLANKNQNVAVLAQALYGSSFETTAPSSRTLGKITAINNELEQRFTFGLLAAEQNYQGAMLAGWGIEDTSVVAGENYIYKVSVALPEESSIIINENSVYASPDLYEELPLPIELAGVFSDSSVLLSWNYDLLSTIYTSYLVERSIDNINYEQQNGQPIFNASEEKEKKQASLYYTDSIPNNKTYFYRVVGKTAFGEVGPPTKPISGKALKGLEFVPRIYKKEIPTDNKAILYWEFKDEGNALISKFQLLRGYKADGPFEMVVDNIPATQRKITFNDLKRINYFTIVAVGKNGVNGESYPAIVQPLDSIPPAPPIGLKGVMDTTGIVKLSWTKNNEDDLGGYRIFRSNNPKTEFSEVTNATFENEIYNDTVVAANLNKKIYYKLQAEDLRFNRSKFSKMLTVDKPDLIAPSPPVITKYEVTSDGIQLNWTPSSSQDVASHRVYRKTLNSTENNWKEVHETKLDSTFLDNTNLIENTYSYTVIAKDSVGLESMPASPITLNWLGKVLEETDIKFSGTVNRELRFINLSWKVKNKDVLEYRLYRGKSEEGLKLYKTIKGGANSFNDVSLEINSRYTYGLQLILKGGTTSLIKKISLKY
ncbi:fibronectin type III domain-containing protein [Zobellia nedashkovskayae]|uniref:fibronectin type III domain-containing protein n=1 Tax=Zobellia nedashkovskayae TaxID=2779510 RepID=UPI001889EFB1|nr:hypothetical protein [Zobellia nedashkovskayae]